MKNQFMQRAIEQAKQVVNDIPVGAIIVYDGEIIAAEHNTKEKNNDVTSHAEILAITKASQFLNSWRLEDCDLYVTLEPCPMCGWAIMQSRIKNVYYGSYDLKYGAFSTVKLDTFSEFKPKIYGGICEKDCDELLNNFFKNVRK